MEVSCLIPFFDVGRFDFFPLDGKHLMAVARGPPFEAAPTFQTLAWSRPQTLEDFQSRCDVFQHLVADFPRYLNLEEITQ